MATEDEVRREEARGRALRAYAVSLARAQLRMELGPEWDVTSGDVAPFDLLADNGVDLTYVSVAIDEGEVIVLSTDQVDFALAHQGFWRLLLVAAVDMRTQIARGVPELRLDGGAVIDVTDEFYAEIDELRPSTCEWRPGVAGADVDSARRLRAAMLAGIWSI